MKHALLTAQPPPTDIPGLHPVAFVNPLVLDELEAREPLSEDEAKLVRIAAARLSRGHKPEAVARLLTERRQWW